MKRKIKSLKPNECIHIRTEKEARKIFKNAKKSTVLDKNVFKDFLYITISKLPLDFIITEEKGIATGKNMIDRPVKIPASDFIKQKSKLKKRVKALEDKTERLLEALLVEANPEAELYKKIAGLLSNKQDSELTELPEKWCVRVTDENKDTLLKWLRKHSECLNLPVDFFVYNDFRTDAWKIWPNEEITFADFKRLVLGEIKTLETNKWYALIENPKCIGCYQNTIDANYGFDEQGNWCTAIAMNNPECWRLLSEEEVKSALISEAEKRGLKEGVKFTALYSCGSSYGMDSIWGFDYHIDFKPDENSLSIIKNDYDWLRLMANGKWATIIEQPKQIDWSVAGQYVKSKVNGFIGITTGLDHEKNASVFYIHPKRAIKGDSSTVNKDKFELLSEPLTINPV